MSNLRKTLFRRLEKALEGRPVRFGDDVVRPSDMTLPPVLISNSKTGALLVSLDLQTPPREYSEADLDALVAEIRARIPEH